jgi:hypothetical protein
MRQIDSSAESTRSTSTHLVESDLDLQPKTPLGRKLIELRAAHVSAGAKLLSADEILAEKARRRGGRQAEISE